MTIDINLLREEKGGNPETVRDSEKRRFRDPALVDKVIALDQDWRKRQYDQEQCKKQIGQVQQKVGQRKRADKADPCADLMEEKAKLEAEFKSLEEQAQLAQESRDRQLANIGNILATDIPTSQDEDKDNRIEVTWGVPRKFDEKYMADGFRPHFELVEMIGGINFEAGRDVFGSRGYFLTGPLVLLNQALINYGLAFLMRDGFEPVQPPFMMKKSIMAQAAELKDYDETLYKVTEGPGKEELDRYLIATSEQPITALYRNKVIEHQTLPLRFAGISTCFRKEAGSHGRDIRGIFRCHQFEKIEQFCITDEKESWKEHEDMIMQAQRFYQSLGFPYRVVTICSGEINDAAAKKYDLEAWFPCDNDGKGQYRELVSCSNCTDFQSRRMNTTVDGQKDRKLPHMLNSTLCATQRAMCCLLENYQTAEGIKVPRVLVPYMAGMEFIPFKKPAPKPEKPAGKK